MIESENNLFIKLLHDKKKKVSYSKQGQEEWKASNLFFFSFYFYTEHSSCHSHQIMTCDFRALLAGAIRCRVCYSSAVYGGRVLHHEAT